MSYKGNGRKGSHEMQAPAAREPERREGRWQARATVDGKSRIVGYGDTFDKATALLIWWAQSQPAFPSLISVRRVDDVSLSGVEP